MSFPSADDLRREVEVVARQEAHQAQKAEAKAEAAGRTEIARQAAILPIIREYLARRRELGHAPDELSGVWSTDDERVVWAEGYWVGSSGTRIGVYAAVPGCRYRLGRSLPSRRRLFSDEVKPRSQVRSKTVQTLTFFVRGISFEDQWTNSSLWMASSTEEALGRVEGTPDEVRAQLIARIKRELRREHSS